MDQLEAALKRIIRYLQQVYGLAEEVFSPGLSKDEIDKRLQNFPFCVPHEVVQLYQYGNGVRETITHVGQNFVIDELLSLDEALREYARLIAFAEEMAKEWDEDPSETWEPQWLPLTQLDLFYHVVQCAPTPQATGPVYYVSRKEDYTVLLAYDSVTSMMETIATCCEMGAYRVAADGVMRENPGLVAQVGRALNPKWTAWWLAQVPGARTTEDLVTFLKHPSRQQFDGGIAAKAAAALCELRDPQTIGPLIQALKDDDDVVRRQVARILCTFCDARTVEPFLQTLGDRDQVVRFQTATALGELGDRRAVLPLIEALRDPEHLVRQNAARALSKLGDMHAVVPLIEALDDPAMAVRADAICSLG
jgi:cell wall assembly regulator SMI1